MGSQHGLRPQPKVGWIASLSCPRERVGVLVAWKLECSVDSTKPWDWRSYWNVQLGLTVENTEGEL